MPIVLLVIALGPLLFAAFLGWVLFEQGLVAERIYRDDNNARSTHAELKRENHAAFQHLEQNSATLMPAIQLCLIASGCLIVFAGGLWYVNRRTPKIQSVESHPLDDPTADSPTN